MSISFPVTGQLAQLFVRRAAAVTVAQSTPDVAPADRSAAQRREDQQHEAQRREAQRRDAARAAWQRAHAERVRDNTAARHPLALR